MMRAPQRPSVEPDRYELLSKLGEGGYGVVYEARDRSNGERVALKELRFVNADSLARFKQEFRAVQEVLHPNLVRLDALFEDRGKWLIAMELVDGQDLLTSLYSDDQELGFEEARLRDAFQQLADALAALHAAGFVHCDLKPSNVRVTPAGRVVLLDFGLATATASEQDDVEARALGTLAYMAPEQGAGTKVGPAADWYAFGVCLFEALCGVPPIEAADPRGLLRAKRELPAPRPSALAPGIAGDLDQLCSALLASDPSARPDEQGVRRVLATRASTPSMATSSAAPVSDAFAGRECELEQLAHAFADAQQGSCRAVLIEGDSGIGKTALVDRFVRSVQASRREVLVLRSRCYENELLAYKAFDGAIDALARVLAKLRPEECAPLLPLNAALLCRLFPTLASVERLALAPLSGVAADPSVQRLEAFAVLGGLLARLGERAPIVLVIDDLQWADAESFRLLFALLGNTQPARTLLLATVRPRAELEGETAAELEALRELRCVNELPLHGLPPAQARALARELMGNALPEAWLETIVKESAGHPMFLTVLARFAGSQDLRATAELTLDLAIAARLGELSGTARKLLQTVALVGSPWAAPLCARAAGVDTGELPGLVADLCTQKLLRRRRAGELACFHDRIRSVAVASVTAPELPARHAEIARTLAAQRDADPAQCARHYELAGELAPAYEAYRRGAERAGALFAFVRAALLYARALEVSASLSLPPRTRTELKIARAHALARGGRSAQAAQQYLEAALESEGEEQTRLRIFATQHLLQSARVEAGMEAARALLRELDVPLPGSPRASVARLLWERAQARVLGRGGERRARPVPLRARMQLDALWGVALPLSWLDPLTSAAVTTRHLRLARRFGEPGHMARALADEAFARAVRDPQDAEADKLLARARTIAEELDDPQLEVNISFREATVATFRWDLPRALERLEHAQRVGIEGCPEQPWLLVNVRTNLSSTWANMGEHARLAAACTAWLAEARDRDDQFALSLLEGLGFGTLRHLMADDPSAGRAALDAVLAPWPREPFSFAHYGEMIGVTYAELYRGGAGAHVWYEREHPRLMRAVLLKRALGKATHLTFRARAGLAALTGASVERRVRLLDDVRACMRALRTVNSKMAAINVLSLDAQLDALVGKLGPALDKTRQVCLQSEQQGNFFLAHSLRYFAGLLEAGDAGRAAREQALAHFAEQGWKSPRRAVAIVCPIVDRLELAG